jgi:hypothetical protein
LSTEALATLALDDKDPDVIKAAQRTVLALDPR